MEGVPDAPTKCTRRGFDVRLAPLGPSIHAFTSITVTAMGAEPECASTGREI